MKELILTHKALNTTETYELPPQKVTTKGHNFTTLKGKTRTGEERVLFRRQAD